MKTLFFLIVGPVFLTAASTVVQVDVLATLSKLAWVTLPVILVVLGNRYFKKRDEERDEQKKMFDKINMKIDEFGETILEQNARFQGIMAKMETTAEEIAEITRDVKDHDRMIAKLEELLK